jgi:hypothetical protein
MHEKCVSNAPVPNESVANTVANGVANKSVEYIRVKLWRDANRDRYNASQRERMRLKRAKAKLGAV